MVKKSTSKYRHVFADDPKTGDFTYTNIPKPYTSGEGSYIAASHKFWAYAKDAAGGPIVVKKLTEFGRVTQNAPTICTHKGRVLDLQFCPYNGNLLATSSEDACLHLHKIPKDGVKDTITDPFVAMGGGEKDHEKRIGLIQWNRNVESVIATAGYDRKVKIYDVSSCEVLRSFDDVVEDNIFSIGWDKLGTRLAILAKTNSRSTGLYVVDPRDPKGCIKNNEAFAKKTAKLFWCPGHLGALGYTKNAKRIMKLWDERKLTEEPAYVWKIDNASGVLMPYFDEDLNLLWLYGKGDSTIYNIEIGGPKGYAVLGAHRPGGTAPTKGGCFTPKRACDVNKCEIARFMKLSQKEIIPLQFCVPRKSKLYQADIYPKTYRGKNRLDPAEWDTGKDVTELDTLSMNPADGENVDEDTVIVKKLTYKELEAENKKLKARVAELEEKLGIKPEETEDNKKEDETAQEEETAKEEEV